jgi:hypothetical protein
MVISTIMLCIVFLVSLITFHLIFNHNIKALLIPFGLFVLVKIITIILPKTKILKDTFTITQTGIQTNRHGMFNWEDIQFVSKESFPYNRNIFIKLKNKKGYLINNQIPWTFSFFYYNYSVMNAFFKEIEKVKRAKGLPFNVYEDKIMGPFKLKLVFLLLACLIIFVIYHTLKK